METYQRIIYEGANVDVRLTDKQKFELVRNRLEKEEGITDDDILHAFGSQESNPKF